MKRPRRWRVWFSAVLVLLVVAACKGVSRRRSTPRPEPSPAPEAVGHLEVIAPEVRVNNQRVRGKTDLFSGYSVRTENTGRATIFFDVGGRLELGPNTDPLFQLVTEGACLVRTIIHTGTFDFFGVTRVCFCDERNEVCGTPESDFRVRITSSGASIIVSKGALRVTVGGRPLKYPLKEGQNMVVQKGKIIKQNGKIIKRSPPPSPPHGPIIK